MKPAPPVTRSIARLSLKERFGEFQQAPRADLVGVMGEEMLSPGAGDALALRRPREEMLELAAQLLDAAVAGEMPVLDVVRGDLVDRVGEQERARRRHLEQAQVHR